MKIIEYRCDNGLPVFLVPMKNTNMMTGVFAVRGGWGYESEGIEGVSHLLEHFMFRGTARRPSTRALAREIEDVGGRLYAKTIEEYIAYFIDIPPEHSIVLCDALADFILHPRLDAAQNQLELEVAGEELRQYESDPMEKFEAAFAELLFPDHPAGWRIGKEASLRRITSDALADYYRSCFTSSNSVVCIAGKMENPDVLFAEVNRLFASLPSAPPLRQSIPFFDRQTQPQYTIVEYNIPDTKIKLGVKCKDVELKDKHSMKVLKSILGDGWTSRLAHRLGEERGFIYRLDIDFVFTGGTSYFAYWGGVKQEQWLEAIRVILEEFAKFCVEKVSAEELERAKRQVLVREKNDWEDSKRLVSYVLDQWADYDDVSFKDETDGIREVSAKDIMRVAQKFFRNEALNLAVIGPHGSEKEEVAKILSF